MTPLARVMLIGRSGAGKTTLMQALRGEKLIYGKTQAVDYVDRYIDTPGEFTENRWMRGYLQVAGSDADIVAFVQSAADTQAVFMNGYRSFFSTPVIGVVTKIDHPEAEVEYACALLELAGVEEIFRVSAFTREGLGALLDAVSNTNISG